MQRLYPTIAFLADGIGDPVVRYSGTIGGSIANNDPAADYPAGLWRWTRPLWPTSERSLRTIASTACLPQRLMMTTLSHQYVLTHQNVRPTSNSAGQHLFLLWWACVSLMARVAHVLS
ncbi:FAD binding domain-containing protein [Aliiroseovarius sp. M344]|nr:FAD binding domain-containing protein [Aliiroseovarius sp. M344]